MSNLAVKVEEPAYLKLMLHAAKYPWAAVSGFLLGEAGSPATEKVVVKDAVPLFHTSTLAPLLETSATMVDAHATKTGLTIVGFYQANQSADKNPAGILAAKIMEQIDSGNAGMSVLLTVSNKRLEIAGDNAISAFTRDASNSFRKNMEVDVSQEVVQAFDSALSRSAESELVDMDEHLDDVTKDWRNPGIAAA